ncbi:hypothetical protein [Actinoplanes sp. NPDC051859]|uniref:hypothetical protein n=1 Tax=Actinoplanes sp. NPDC051859 TaxID=3363909 RepID=UPI0037A20DC0
MLNGAVRPGGLAIALSGTAAAAIAMAAAPWVRAQVLPIMVLPLLLAVIAGGAAAAALPRWAAGGAIVAAVAAVQVAGMATVARRDILNFAGAGGTSYDQAYLQSPFLTALAVAAAAAAGLALLMALLLLVDPRRLVRAYRSLEVWAGLLVVAAVPIGLCWALGYGSLSALGQFALWWSVPWGLALVAAGIARAQGRWAAWLSLAGSVALSVACVVAPLLNGPYLRFPD